MGMMSLPSGARTVKNQDLCRRLPLAAVMVSAVCPCLPAQTLLIDFSDPHPPPLSAASGILPMAGSRPAHFPSCIPAVGALAYLLAAPFHAGMDRPKQSRKTTTHQLPAPAVPLDWQPTKINHNAFPWRGILGWSPA